MELYYAELDAQVAKMTSQDKATCKAYFKHLDSLSERNKPIHGEDESQIHLESK
jgi:hypothetical protein